MAEIGRWGGYKFEVESGYVLGFTGLSVKGSSETEDKTSSSQKYVSRKNGKPTEITLTVHLNALTGCENVRDAAMGLVDAARTGKKDYFYIKNSKLVTCQVMLTEAQVKEIKMTNGGDWIMCDVQLTLKQCSKMDGTTGGSSSGSGGSSGGGSQNSGSSTSTYKVQIPGMSVLTVQATSVQGAITKAGCQTWTGTVYVNGSSYYVVKGVISTKPSSTSTKTSTTSKAVSTVTNAVKNAVTAATNVIKKITDAAKKASTTQKTTTKTTTTAKVVKPAATTTKKTTAVKVAIK